MAEGKSIDEDLYFNGIYTLNVDGNMNFNMGSAMPPWSTSDELDMHYGTYEQDVLDGVIYIYRHVNDNNIATSTMFTVLTYDENTSSIVVVPGTYTVSITLYKPSVIVAPKVQFGTINDVFWRNMEVWCNEGDASSFVIDEDVFNYVANGGKIYLPNLGIGHGGAYESVGGYVGVVSAVNDPSSVISSEYPYFYLTNDTQSYRLATFTSRSESLRLDEVIIIPENEAQISIGINII